MDTQGVISVISAMADEISACKDELTELDMPIGDSDHGINMARGFEAVRAQLPELAQADTATVLKKCGMTLVSHVGGSSGPLYGTAFMKAGAALKGVEDIGMDDFARALEAAVEGVKARGRSTTGEKTMLDAMVPALEAAREAAAQGVDASAALAQVADAAEKGAESTVGMVATKGRASYLGERSRGHKDPGAASFACLMRAAARCMSDETA